MKKNLKIFNLKVLILVGSGLFFCFSQAFDDAKNNNLYLFRAAKNGDLDWVKKLVEKEKADINYRTSSGKTVLIKAVSRKRNKVVQYLLGLKDKDNKILVDFNLADKNGQTALHKAAKVGDCEILEILVMVGADKNKQDRFGNTALHIAAKKGDLNIVKKLIGSGANFEIKNNKGDTPLHEAVKTHYKIVVEFLIKSSANLGVKNNNGKMPVDYAKPDIKNVFIRL